MKQNNTSSGNFSNLKKAVILDGLQDTDIAVLSQHGNFITFKNGEVIMQEGENADSMYIFLDGEVEVSKNLTLKLSSRSFGHVEKAMNKLKASDAWVFGEMSLFQTEPRSATVTALTECKLFEISRNEFKKFCREKPLAGIIILERIAAILSSRLRKSNQDVLKLSTALSIALNR